MAKLILFWFILINVETICQNSGEYIRGCYYRSRPQHMPRKGKYVPENYVPGLCTHIFYAFAGIDPHFSIQPYEKNDLSVNDTKGMYERINDLKLEQPGLKTLISIDCGTSDPDYKKVLKDMIFSFVNRQTFINNSIHFVRQHNFDGIDIDWEYPENEDKIMFRNFIRELSEAFHNQGLIATAAVAGDIHKINTGYDYEAMTTLDFINVMTYDIHGLWERKTGFNSPLFERDGDGYSVKSAVEHWFKKGVPKNKIVVGFPTFGHSWTLVNRSMDGVGAPATKAQPGPVTNNAGFLAYYEICDMISTGGVRRFDNTQQCPYVVKGDQWVGYDDTTSYEKKLDWLKENGYKGAFVWAMDYDDFKGECLLSGGKKHVLLSYIRDKLTN